MFGTNFFQEGLEGFKASFMPEFPGYMIPNFEHFNNDIFSKEFLSSLPPLAEIDGFDQKSFIQMFDEGIKNLPEEMKNWLPIPFDFIMSPVEEKPRFQMPTPQTKFIHQEKIGTISVEERRLKVLKFLEKRKLRSYKKKISYICRKRGEG